MRRLIGRDTTTDRLADFGDEWRVRAVLRLSGMPVDGLVDGVQQVCFQ
ncbi:hypothetical protein [Micromonospora sp. HM5-17]|nr:hypothetical protein [Micromonospora sp. HM5-17]